MKHDQLLTYEFSSQKYIESHHHYNIELLYILSGSLVLTIDEEKFTLMEQDIVLINSTHKHSFYTEDDVFYVMFQFNYHKILSMIHASKVFFLCNSSMENKPEYNELHRLIRNILKEIHENESNQLTQNIGYFQLINFLVQHFAITYSNERKMKGNKNNERTNEIEGFIEANYHKNISLNDLANYLYLSSPYLSKYFKEQLGMNFYKYLNNIRLHHSLDDLLGSDQSITSIAMNNGFPNVSSFNKWFKETYQTTPHDYRLKHNKIGELENEFNWRENLKLILKNLPNEDENKKEDNINSLEVEASNEIIFLKYWSKVINLNEISNMKSSNLHDQMTVLKEELGFEYGRIWNLFSKEMKIFEASKSGNISFFNLERIFDSLMEMKIKPYIVLNPVEDLLHLGIANTLEQNKKIELFSTVFQSLISHLINRYGLRQVQDWYFEVTYTPNSEQINTSFFYHIFNAIKETLLSFSPDFKVGGAGLPLNNSSEVLKRFLTDWFRHPYHPDFLTLHLSFQSNESDGNEKSMRKLLDAQFMQNQVRMVKKIMDDEGHNSVDIQISNWNFSSASTHILNDSSYKAAYLMKNIIDFYGLLQGMGYWYALDSLSPVSDTPQLLYGGPGLLSKQGVKKPSYYTYSFLNIGESKYFLGKDSHSLITTNGTDNYFIVCHNCGTLNHQYYMEQHEAFDPIAYKDFWDVDDLTTLHYQIKGIKNGKYKIKIRSVSETYGNIQYEWIKLNAGSDLSKSEIDYLRQVSVPQMRIQQVDVTDGVLEFKTILSINEIQSIRITYQY